MKSILVLSVGGSADPIVIDKWMIIYQNQLDFLRKMS